MSVLHVPQARRVRSGLSAGQLAADLRRAWPYGFQFQSDWLTRLEAVRGAAAGLEYMHQHGVIHRDLTSYNLLLDFGKPWQVRHLSGWNYVVDCRWFDCIRMWTYLCIAGSILVCEELTLLLCQPAEARPAYCLVHCAVGVIT